MKRIMVLVIVAVAVSTTVFARGGMETGNGDGNRQVGNGSGDVVTLSGSVIEKDGHVFLETQDGTVSLSAPGFPRAGVEVPYGETIEVTGTYKDCNDADCDAEAEGHLFVDAAVSESGSYTFENGRGNTGGNSNSGRTGRRSNSGEQGHNSDSGLRDGRGRAVQG